MPRETSVGFTGGMFSPDRWYHIAWHLLSDPKNRQAILVLQVTACLAAVSHHCAISQRRWSGCLACYQLPQAGLCSVPQSLPPSCILCQDGTDAVALSHRNPQLEHTTQKQCKRMCPELLALSPHNQPSCTGSGLAACVALLYLQMDLFRLDAVHTLPIRSRS